MSIKTIVCLVMALCFTSTSFAECDFSTGIESTSDGRYAYSKDCHIRVGEMKRDLGIAETKLQKLGLAIQYKDLALSKANERADLWMQTSESLGKRVTALESLEKKNKWIYFGLGVLATGATIYLANGLLRP